MTRVATVLRALRRRHRAAVGHVRDAGASALEFAIIAAVVVVASSVIGAVVYNIVRDKGDDLQRCANLPAGAVCDEGGGGGQP